MQAKRTRAEITFDKPRRRIDVLVLAVMAKGIQAALLGLDLDNLRSVGGKESSRIRAGITGGESQNANALKNLVGGHGIKKGPRSYSAPTRRAVLHRCVVLTAERALDRRAAHRP